MKGKLLSDIKNVTKHISLAIVITLVVICLITNAAFSAMSKNEYLTKAQELYNNYDFDHAYKLLEEGAEKYKNNDDFNYWMLKIANTAVLLDTPNPGNTIPYASSNKIAENGVDSRNVKILTESGRYYWLNNNRNEAVVCFKKAIDIKPDYYPAYNYLGNYYYQPDPNTSAKYYEKLFTLNPDSLDFMGVTISDDTARQILKNVKLKALYLSGSNKTLIEGLGSLTNLEILYLIQQGETSGDLNYIKNLKNLKVLSLQFNHLSRIPSLEDLPNLEILHLNDNQITKIENLDKLNRLKILDLRSNQLTKLENLDTLTGLRRLYLSHNRIRKIEGLDSLAQLAILDLYDNQITKLENLGGLTNLKILHLYFNQIGKLENLDSLANLQNLYLRGNQIATIENLDKLTNLEILDLYENKVKKLENLGQLTKLKELILYGNQIGRIEDLNTQTNLRMLDLRKNRIAKIENLDALTNLPVLMISFNDIKKLENLDKLKNLQELYASYIKIGKIENLTSLTKLQKLYLGGNNINTIENLDSLANLKLLYLADNNIPKIQNLSKLTNLQTLALGSNKISTVENLNRLKNLETLDLSVNRISELANFPRLPNLRNLSLANNQFGMKGDTKLEIPPSFGNLKDLFIGGPDYMHPGNIKTLSGLDNLKSIEGFEFSHQNLTELPDVSALKNIKKLHIEKSIKMKAIDYAKVPAGVKSLILWNVNLKDLSGIERLTTLEELWVGENPGLKTLSRLNDIKTLKSLNVGLCSNLPSEELLKLSNIRTLIVADNQYPPQVIDALKKKGINVQLM